MSISSGSSPIMPCISLVFLLMMHLLLPAYSQDNQLAVSAYPQLLVNSHSNLYIQIHVNIHKRNPLYLHTFRLLLSDNVGLLASLVSWGIKVSGATATADVCLIHSLMSISALLGDNWPLDRDSFCRSLVTPFVSSWLLATVCWTHPANKIQHTNLKLLPFPVTVHVLKSKL